MPRTTIKSHQIFNEGVKREDLNSTTSGQAVVKKIVAGTGIDLSETGVDNGTGDVTITATGASSSLIKQGIENISNSATTVAVTFDNTYADTDYSIESNIINIVDGAPSQYSYTITSKSTTGFTVTLSGAADSANYKLDWITIRNNTQSTSMFKGFASFNSGCIEYRDANEIYIPANTLDVNGKLANWDAVLTKTLTGLSNNTWYYIYIDESEIDSFTNVTASEIIYNTTAPTKDNTKRGWYNGNDRCIGAILSDGSGNIKEFYWNIHSGLCLWESKIIEVSGGVSTTPIDISLNSSIPNFGEITAYMLIIGSGNTGNSTQTVVYLYRNGGGAQNTSSITADSSSTTLYLINQVSIITDSSQIIEYSISASSKSSWIYTLGFYLNI